MVPALGAISTFLALVLAAVWAFGRSSRLVDARVRALMPGAAAMRHVEGATLRQRVLVPMVEGLGARIARLMPAQLVRQVEQRLTVAGQPLRSSTFWSLTLTFAAALGSLWLLLVLAASDGAPHPLLLLTTIPIALVGATPPLLWLTAAARRRQDAIIRGMPDSLDLITICLEAGLGLDGAFQQVANNQDGPFADEIRRVLREVGLGKARRQALLDLGDRTDLDDVRALVNAIVQAQQLGTSMTPVLRAETKRLRIRRRQQVEAQARRAPVKMVFPLVFCLMPALFIFILGPLLVGVVDFLSGQ